MTSVSTVYHLLLLSGARSSSSSNNSCTNHLPAAAATPASALPSLLAIHLYLPSEESKGNTSGPLARASDATAATFAPGSTTMHTKVTVAARFGQKMPPVTKFSPAVPSGSNQGQSVKSRYMGTRGADG